MLVCTQVEYSPLLTRHFLGLLFNRLRVLLLPSSLPPPPFGWDVSLLEGYPQHFLRLPWQFAVTHLDAWVKRGTVSQSKVCCPRTQQNDQWPRQILYLESSALNTMSPTIVIGLIFIPKTFGINYQKVSSFLFILIVVPSYTLRLITRPLRLPQLLSSWPLNRLLGRSILIFSPSAR